MIDNKTGLLFGPAGAAAGVVILIAAIGIIHTWVGLILLILSTFFIATYTGTRINLKVNEIKQYTALFGLFKIGDKESLNGFSGLVILPDREKYQVHSQSNRSLSTSSGKYIIALIDDSSYRQVLVGKYKNMDQANQKVQEYSQVFDLPIIETFKYD